MRQRDITAGHPNHPIVHHDRDRHCRHQHFYVRVQIRFHQIGFAGFARLLVIRFAIDFTAVNHVDFVVFSVPVHAKAAIGRLAFAAGKFRIAAIKRLGLPFNKISQRIWIHRQQGRDLARQQLAPLCRFGRRIDAGHAGQRLAVLIRLGQQMLHRLGFQQHTLAQLLQLLLLGVLKRRVGVQGDHGGKAAQDHQPAHP